MSQRSPPDLAGGSAHNDIDITLLIKALSKLQPSQISYAYRKKTITILDYL